MALISRRYFIDGASKIDIAEQTGLSRFKVARLLDRARSLGLVKIDISYPGTIAVGASSRLQQALRLRHALVLDAVEDEAAALRADLGAAAAELISEIVTPDDVLGL